LKDQKVVLV